MAIRKQHFWSGGEAWIWLTSACLTLLLLLTVGFFAIIAINGLQALWARNVAVVTLKSGEVHAGSIVQEDNTLSARLQLKTGNRDLYGYDFKWLEQEEIVRITYPPTFYVLERMEYGNFYGELAVANHETTKEFFRTGKLPAHLSTLLQEIEQVQEQTGEYNDFLLQQEREKQNDKQAMQQVRAKIDALHQRARVLEEQITYYTANFITADKRQVQIKLVDIVHFYQPNAMHLFAKLLHYGEKFIELLIDNPREANTEGGVFPAAFGTVLLVFLMSITSFPFGVLAGVYLGLYARDGWLLRIVRIAVNNLAGIPSIVFGIFGLGFFIYGLGATVDELFFASTLPEPTFGTGGILWASLTLGLLTLPVVIVATEEALKSVPISLRDSSLALGATRFQTLHKVLFPAASSGILTGFILAMARAAGEVAPLMITGVVKLAPSLPIDGSFPFLHLDRKFMHLGFHIFDLSYQSPNVEAAKPLMYASTLLLLAIVVLMTSSSIYLRAHLRKKYRVSYL